MSFRLFSRTYNKYLILRTTDCIYQHHYFSSKPLIPNTMEIDPITGKPRKKKTPVIPKITLLQGDNLTVTTLEEAQKLSKRRDLRLVKIIDINNKTQRPVYRMMTGPEYNEEELKQREIKKLEKEKNNTLKGEKVLMLNQNISEHDLQTHIKKILKWLQKSYEVRIAISGDPNSINKADEVYNSIEKSINTEGRILQKRLKGSDIKFQIVPPKKNKKEEPL